MYNVIMFEGRMAMTSTVVFVKGLQDEGVRSAIENELKETRVTFRFDMNNGAIVVEGDHDMATIVKKVVEEMGYEVL